MKFWPMFLTIIVMVITNVQNEEVLQDKELDMDILKEVYQCYINHELRDLARSLPMTLDYFLNLIEKIQKNPRMKSWKAQEMAAALLTRFQINGVEDTILSAEVGVPTTKPWNEVVKMQIVRQFMITPPGKYDEGTLKPEEECALHFMLSWSNNVTNPTNVPDSEFYPRSSGLVYSGVFGNLALGPVLQGIAAIETNKVVQEVVDALNGEPILGSSNETLASVLKSVCAATISAELAQSVLWSLADDRPLPVRYVGPKGYWNNTYCPNSYSLAEKSVDVMTMATAPEIVGAVDGYLIASSMQTPPTATGLKSVTLAQIIRMYYGKGLLQNDYNACERRTLYSNLAASVHQQTQYLAYVFASVSKIGIGETYINKNVGYVMSAFQQDYLNTNFLACNESNSNYFNGKNQKNELKNDVLFVMDVNITNSDDGFWDQKEFVLNVMREVDTIINGSRYGLYSNGAQSRELFKLDPNYPSARRRCDILQKEIKSSTPDMAATISYMNDIITGLKNMQKNNKIPLAPGKVIIFVYLEESFGAGKEDVEREIKLLKTAHPDVTILAVGRYLEPIKLLVRDKVNDVFYHRGEPLVYHVPNILKRFTNVPVTLEYADCVQNDRELESGLVGHEFVYADTNQWFAVPHIYMNTSSELQIQVRADYGTVRVCTTRRNPETTPTFESKDCQEASSTGSSQTGPVITLGPLNPCSGYPFGGCANYYFQVQGRKNDERSPCTDDDCDSLHQIHLTITHTNMRCAGSFTGVEISFLVMSVFVSILTLWA